MRTRIRWGNIIIIGHRTLGAVQQQVAAVVVLLLVVLAVCAERGYGAIQEHLVTNLPGQPVVSFLQYAGYIPVDASGSKQLFYWFVEADHKDAASLPIAFWFNGGTRLV
jgi:serine carboxypeptidase-like clade 2